MKPKVSSSLIRTTRGSASFSLCTMATVAARAAAKAAAKAEVRVAARAAETVVVVRVVAATEAARWRVPSQPRRISASV
jgi:hypothetical protein